MANEGYHEPIEELQDATRDMHRATVADVANSCEQEGIDAA